MKAMLEARIVAASTQRPRAFEHVDLAVADRTMFSSHGSRRIAHIVLVLAERLVCVAVKPPLVWLRRSDDWMSARVRMFARVLVGRTVATQCRAALLTSSQMQP